MLRARCSVLVSKARWRDGSSQVYASINHSHPSSWSSLASSADPAGPGDPTLRGDRIVKVRQMTHADVQGDDRGLDVPVLGEVAGVRALPMVEALPHSAEPPQRRTHAVVGLG